MAKQIAIVRLAPGEIGYYDDMSRIFLNVQNPIGRIYDDMNHTKIRESIADGKLVLVAGTFVPATAMVEDKVRFINNIKEEKVITPELIKPVIEAVDINNENTIETKKTRKKSTRKKKENN